MQKKLLIILTVVLTIVGQALKAQNSDIKRTWHWYFGDHAGIDFSGGSPVADTKGQLATWGGTVSVSDSLGNLLFSSEGTNIYNRNNQEMPNDDSLWGSFGIPPNMSQMVAVPLPGNENIYYLFSMDYTSDYTDHWVYHIIDMTKQGGLGDVVSKRNPMDLEGNPSSKITATRHKNGKDIWIISMGLNTNKYYAFLLTSTGLSTTPVISIIGPPEKGGQCEMKTSFDGKKIASTCFQNIVISDFDNSTGIISKPIIMPTCYHECFFNGIEFSPDNKKLYASCTCDHGDSQVSSSGNSIYQVLIKEDSASTVNSLTQLDTLSIVDSTGTLSNSGYNFTYSMHIGSDGLIYTTQLATQHIGAIREPNNIGLTCNYKDSVIFLSGKYCQFGFPGFLRDYFYIDSLSTVVENYQDNNELVNIYPNPFNDYTTINLSGTLVKNVQFKLYDITGKEVTQIVNIKKTSSTAFIIKPINLSNGLYFLHTEINQQTLINKLLLIN